MNRKQIKTELRQSQRICALLMQQSKLLSDLSLAHTYSDPSAYRWYIIQYYEASLTRKLPTIQYFEKPFATYSDISRDIKTY